MNPALFQQPFFQVTLPIVVTFVTVIWISSWSQNKFTGEVAKRLDERLNDINRRFDDIHRRLDEIIKRLDRIETKLDDHEKRIVTLEERTSPIGRRG
jgi:chromosome segregation ATPase